MEKAIVELRVVQTAKKGEDGELVFIGYTLQRRVKYDPVWRDVPVVLRVVDEE